MHSLSSRYDNAQRNATQCNACHMVGYRHALCYRIAMLGVNAIAFTVIVIATVPKQMQRNAMQHCHRVVDTWHGVSAYASCR